MPRVAPHHHLYPPQDATLYLKLSVKPLQGSFKEVLSFRIILDTFLKIAKIVVTFQHRFPLLLTSYVNDTFLTINGNNLDRWSLTKVHTSFGCPQFSPSALFLSQDPIQDTRYLVLLSLGSSWLRLFLKLSLFLMTFTVSRSQVFCIMSLKWKSSAVFLRN